MEDNVVLLHPASSVSVGLRNIADAIDRGEYAYEKDCTLVMGTEVFQLGEIDDSRAAVNAVWDLTYAVHKLMAAGRGE